MATGSGERGNMFLDAQTSARLSAFKARLRALESPMVKENPGGDKFSCEVGDVFVPSQCTTL